MQVSQDVANALMKLRDMMHDTREMFDQDLRNLDAILTTFETLTHNERERAQTDEDRHFSKQCDGMLTPNRALLDRCKFVAAALKQTENTLMAMEFTKK